MDSIRPRTISEYLKLARAHKWRIAIPALIFIAASAIVIIRLPNSYQSSTFVLVSPPQGDSAETNPIDLPHRLATVRQQVTSRSRLQDLIEKFGLYPEQTGRGVPMDSVIAQMRTDIDVDVSGARADATDAFSISYKARNPYIAQQVTSELASQLIADNVKALEAEASGQADVLNSRSAELSAKLHEMESRSPWLISLKDDAPLALPTGGGSQSHAASMLAGIRQQQMAMGTIRDQQYKVQQQIDDLDRRIAEQKQLVEKQKKSALPPNNATFGALIAKRAELQGQKENLVKTQGLTEKHPRVIAVNDQIDSINKAIDELKRQESAQGVQSPDERELSTLEMQRDQLKIDLQVTQRELDRQASNAPIITDHSPAPAGPVVPRDAASARLAQDYLDLKQTYKDVTLKLQRAELQTQAMESSKVERFRILDEANLPEVPVWPNRPLLLLAAFGLGIFAGVAVWLSLEFRKFGTLQDLRDVEHYTGLPMLAAIPRTVTQAERDRQARTIRFRIALGSVAALVVTAVLSKALAMSHLFEILGRK
ncbi:MAG TPA: GNVR domain-containing protein [Blastocatellia bacterium]